MANKLLVGQAFAIGIDEYAAYPDHSGEYSEALGSLLDDLGVDPRYIAEGHNWYSLSDVLEAMQEKLIALEAKDDALDSADDDLQNQIDALETRIEALEAYHE